MNADDILQLAQNPNNIEGIFNYCDRWCERCAYTSRCTNFAMGELQYPDGNIPDIENAEFWKGMEDIFRVTMEVMAKVAAEQGVELQTEFSEEESAAMDAERESSMERATNHPCTGAAKAYADMADAWLGNSEDAFKAKETELNDFIRLNVAPTQAEEQAASITDAVEVIRWYQLFIQVKIMRALQGKKDETDDAEFWAEYPKDSDGSAKVALIAVDRSISAWGLFLRLFPNQETSILEILAQLDQTRRMIEAQFPQARAFIRPGFDTHPNHS